MIPVLTQNQKAVFLLGQGNDLRYRNNVRVGRRDGNYYLELSLEGIWFSSDPQASLCLDAENIIKYLRENPISPDPEQGYIKMIPEGRETCVLFIFQDQIFGYWAFISLTSPLMSHSLILSDPRSRTANFLL